MINPECSICNIINQLDNDDVTLFDNETVGTGWRIALMNDQGAVGPRAYSGASRGIDNSFLIQYSYGN